MVEMFVRATDDAGMSEFLRPQRELLHGRRRLVLVTEERIDVNDGRPQLQAEGRLTQPPDPDVAGIDRSVLNFRHQGRATIHRRIASHIDISPEVSCDAYCLYCGSERPSRRSPG